MMTHSTLPDGAEPQLAVQWRGNDRVLTVTSADDVVLARFAGEVENLGDIRRLTGKLSAKNAAAARGVASHLVPQPIGLRTSAGMGDRLGLATPGQVQAVRHAAQNIRTIFAQQSIREMDRLHRTPQQVLDDATFGCIEAGWRGPVGADADHLKTTDDIDRCLEAGFTLFTIDVGDFVNPHAGIPSDAELAELPWGALEDDLASVRRRYGSLVVDTDAGPQRVGDQDLAHALGKYGRAVAEGVRLYRHLVARASYPVEVEIAVDETDEPTTAAEHLYIATELARLGVTWVSFAPRHLGTFEKGVEFRGDQNALYASIATHAAIARALGPYKIGMHSGSDKFSIYAGLMRETRGLVHLKTSGTSYLTALAVIAQVNPELFRSIYADSLAAFVAARASYQVSAELASVPPADAVADLPSLLERTDTRQILHVGYGAVLSGRDVQELFTEIRAHHKDYDAALAEHIGRHLAPFAQVVDLEKDRV